MRKYPRVQIFNGKVWKRIANLGMDSLWLLKFKIFSFWNPKNLEKSHLIFLQKPAFNFTYTHTFLKAVIHTNLENKH